MLICSTAEGLAHFINLTWSHKLASLRTSRWIAIVPPVDLLQNMNKFWDSTCFGLARSRLNAKSRGDFLFLFFCFKPVDARCPRQSVGNSWARCCRNVREFGPGCLMSRSVQTHSAAYCMWKRLPLYFCWSLYNKRALQEGGRRRWPSVSQPAAQPACKTD